VKTARNAIRLLREFTNSPKLGVSELARRLNLDRATVHRMLRTLYDERMIDQDPDTHLYRLGSGIIEIAQAFVLQYDIPELARSELEQLRDAIGETVALQVREGKEAVCIATAESRYPVRVAYVIGERMPLHCTSSGFVFLASMTPTMRADALSGELRKYTARTVTQPEKILRAAATGLRAGYYIADETYHEGARTISAPILDAKGDTIAALTVAAPVQRLSSKDLLKISEPLLRAARTISTKIIHSSMSAGSR
jgi:DNA-binding IclR family transcriptional regulator